MAKNIRRRLKNNLQHYNDNTALELDVRVWEITYIFAFLEDYRNTRLICMYVF